MIVFILSDDFFLTQDFENEISQKCVIILASNYFIFPFCEIGLSLLVNFVQIMTITPFNVLIFETINKHITESSNAPATS